MRFEERVPSRAGCQSGSPQSGESTLYKLYLPYTLHAGYPVHTVDFYSSLSE